MPIPIKQEPKEFYKEFKVYEKCVFCLNETKTWHENTNTPVCKNCAKSHNVEDIKMKQTALQKLKEKLESQKEFYGTRFIQLESWIDELMEYEKQQIQSAFENGMIKESSSNRYISDLEAEKYYQKTYKK
jgi:hypothetical protein